jgi:hypothetical protein
MVVCSDSMASVAVPRPPEETWWLRLRQSCEISEYVVIGEVVDRRGIELNNRIYTEYRMPSPEVLVGEVTPDSALHFVAPGGTYKDKDTGLVRGTVLSGGYRPWIGHRWLVFLRSCGQEEMFLTRASMMVRLFDDSAHRALMRDTVQAACLMDSVRNAVAVRSIDWQMNHSELAVLANVISVKLRPDDARHSAKGGEVYLQVIEVFKSSRGDRPRPGEIRRVRIPKSPDREAGANRTLPPLGAGEMAVFFLNTDRRGEALIGRSIWSKWRRSFGEGVVESWQERTCAGEMRHRHAAMLWTDLVKYLMSAR